MRRPHNGCLPPPGRRSRQHRHRDLPVGNPRTRTWYSRLLGTCPPPPKVLAVLNVLLEAARDGLDDVVLTQPQILERLLGGPDAAVWGWSITSLRRVLRQAEADRWISIEDRAIPGRGIQINCYRLHVPTEHAATWERVTSNAENARVRAVRSSHRRATESPARGPDTATDDYLSGSDRPGADHRDVAAARRRVTASVKGGLVDEEIIADVDDTYATQPDLYAAALDELARLRAGP